MKHAKQGILLEILDGSRAKVWYPPAGVVKTVHPVTIVMKEQWQGWNREARLAMVNPRRSR